ncbi:hypothetical protein A2U01_0005882, partial [Trifolium medium]|nr:hypothetical protein [Trifolium medium]
KTPFEIVYGRPPPTLTRWLQGETRVEAVQRDLLDRDEALRQLRNQLLAHRQQSVVTRIHAKLAAKYYGPYPIIEKIGAVAYKLKLPEGSKVHPVFHVSLLKKAVGQYNEKEELPELLEEQSEMFEPETVLATRKVKHQGEEVRQVLIHWKGKTAEEATWEDEIMIRSQFPKFGLEDKAIAEGESVDRTQTMKDLPHEQLIHNEVNGPKTWLVYSRRKGKMGMSG